MQEQDGRPGATMAHAQDDVTHVDAIEFEAFEHAAQASTIPGRLDVRL